MLALISQNRRETALLLEFFLIAIGVFYFGGNSIIHITYERTPVSVHHEILMVFLALIGLGWAIDNSRSIVKIKQIIGIANLILLSYLSAVMINTLAVSVFTQPSRPGIYTISATIIGVIFCLHTLAFSGNNRIWRVLFLAFFTFIYWKLSWVQTESAPLDDRLFVPLLVIGIAIPLELYRKKSQFCHFYKKRSH